MRREDLGYGKNAGVVGRKGRCCEGAMMDQLEFAETTGALEWGSVVKGC